MEETKVYIPDKEHGWLAATLLSLEGGTAQVLLEKDDVLKVPGEHRQVDMGAADVKAQLGGSSSFPLQNLNVPETGVPDMCTLSYLHEPAILYNLRRRFLNESPYTYTGDICIAVNPYQWLQDLYAEDLRTAYLHAAEKKALPPHAYAISAAAYRGVRDEGRNQSILVSGESGAGKTETVKILMSHLASVCENASHDSTSVGKEASCEDVDEESSASQQHRTIEKVLESNPLLESFGNAKTVRNDNSSRFGKFMQLQFQRLRPGVELLVGSRCVTYLLEKSRVVGHSAGERNYHIFYQLLSAPEEVKARHGVAGKTVRDFHYMACDHGGSDTTEIEGRSDADRFHSTMHALGLIGVTPDVQGQMLSALAGILYLGEVSFVGVDGQSGEEARIKEDPSDGIGHAATWLGCTREALEEALCKRTVKVRHESMQVPMTPAQALDARDALSKEVYSRLFGWLVDKINTSTAVKTLGPHKGHLRTIGLLDIFGFESFKVNRFEQLCINYANEKIQQKFTSDVFKTVQAEYEEEGITWNFIEFKDNAAVLDLIEGRMGIITMLNEECILPKGGDASFISKLTTCHNEHAHLAAHKLAKMDFTIHHYAGSVQYTSTGFVARNRDTLQEDLQKALSEAPGEHDNSLIRQVFSPPSLSTEEAPAAGGGAQRRGKGNIGAETVTSKFKAQLADLMDSIASTRVQYIRCIKPNPIKSPSVLNHMQVIEQLRCAGVIEAIRISRAAYPNRLDLKEFVQRFRMLAPSLCPVTPSNGDKLQPTVKQLLARLLPSTADGPVQYEMGKTKVYFRLGALESLEERRGRILSQQATIMQRYYRGWRQRHAYVAMRRRAIRVQSLARRWRQMARYAEARRRVIKLQCLWRSKQAKERVQARRVFVRSTAIQAAARGHLARRRYVKAKAGTTRLQAWARMRRDRRAYKLALAEAKEQAKLENQLEALRRRLEEESNARLRAEEQLKERAAAMAQQPQAQTTSPGQLQQQLTPEASNLMEQQGQMLEYLKRKIIKFRDQLVVSKQEIDNLKKENEALRAENQRVKDAHAAAGLSFTALNDHSSHLQRINKRLMKEHQEAMEQVKRAREEGHSMAEKLSLQLARAKEELSKTKELYGIEVQIRMKMDRIMQEMVRLVGRRVSHVDPELFEEMAEMQHTCAIGTTAPAEEPTGGLGALLGWGGASVDDHHANVAGAGTSRLERDESVMKRASKVLSGFSKLF